MYRLNFDKCNEMKTPPGLMQETGEFPDTWSGKTSNVRCQHGGPVRAGMATASQRSQWTAHAVPAQITWRCAALQPAKADLECQETVPCITQQQVRLATGEGCARFVKIGSMFGCILLCCACVSACVWVFLWLCFSHSAIWFIQYEGWDLRPSGGQNLG